MELNKDRIRKLREHMIENKIENAATGWYEYNGKMYELYLLLKEEEIDS